MSSGKNILMANRAIAQIIKAGKEYKIGDTTITALQPSSMDLYSGELSIPIFKQLNLQEQLALLQQQTE